MQVDLSRKGSARPAVASILCLLLALVALFALSNVASAAPSPFGVGLPETSSPLVTTGLWGEVQGWILARQSEFYNALKDAVKLVRESWSALGLLLLLSFAYGAFHAAGPGHGKVVLTTYLFASGTQARKGALMALIAAMLQASVAVVIIGVVAILLRMTAVMITKTAMMLELASYVMFVALGLWLFWRAWRAVRSLLADHDDHSHENHDHHHHHDHDHHHGDGECGCGHTHAPSLDAVGQARGMRGTVLAVLSMGLRPCSGALIVLVFALSQGVFWAGILSAYAMGLGTGLSIALLALFAVYARSASQSLAARGLNSQIVDWGGAIILIAAGVVVSGFGVILLLANLL
ncbi:ABC-type nickel/cobalt efflux system, permease component RcnA [Cohaesibacter sp. ES.047]|uniref:nickel/cobalt transporter n=1 Tax=Cohaesibacter sp. ES.047 TaxID=1798205 RepID=UPI000BB97D77|nr:nickel/cobalt transporter [Cohaesibacter sp. ES.047]SNY90916.1 ABC-type nickel/cobalt efflux system, permease component RcnA [Cohaesibacter sp. ES.047]